MQNVDSRRAGLMAIGIFKLIKALVLVVLGIGVFKLVHHDILEVLSRWVGMVLVDPDNKYFQQVVTKLWSVDDRKLEEVGAGTFFYAGGLPDGGPRVAAHKDVGRIFHYHRHRLVHSRRGVLDDATSYCGESGGNAGEHWDRVVLGSAPAGRAEEEGGVLFAVRIKLKSKRSPKS
jgi:hypothetical protein